MFNRGYKVFFKKNALYAWEVTKSFPDAKFGSQPEKQGKKE